MGENNAAEQPNTSKSFLLTVLPFAGFAAVLAGGLIAFLNRNYIGWFAYAPLSKTPFTVNGAALITQGTQVGIALTVVGLLLLAFWAGYRVGRKTR
jgi:heme/copper-type cytochrome/quinol oxidase subunit 1